MPWIKLCWILCLSPQNCFFCLPPSPMTNANWSHRHRGLSWALNTCNDLELMSDSVTYISGRNQQPGIHSSWGRKTALKLSDLQERGSAHSLLILCLPSILPSDHFCENYNLSFSTRVVKRIMWSWYLQWDHGHLGKKFLGKSFRKNFFSQSG